MLEALAHHARHGRHDVPGALVPLERAVRLAGAEGHVRVFVAEGAPMVLLLEALAARAPGPGHLRRLLDAVAPGGPPTSAEAQGLPDPLTRRELEVLALLASDLSGPAIARQLVVSLNTVRTHTKGIYAKLGVDSRRGAVARAAALRLLPPAG